MPVKRGDRLGVYEIVDAIGAGGMGEVFRAQDTSLGRTVALKVLPDDLLADPDRRARFEREARMLAQLNHPRIAAVYGVNVDGAVPYLAMEFAAGETLDREIARGPIAAPQVTRIFRELADALAAAHERGIIHRDLKPANIMRSTDGSIKVLDFGLAKALDTEGNAAAAATITGVATRAGFVLGTAAYMSPEQALGRPVDQRTDIWALGCVLYECLTGQRAFTGNTSAEAIAGVLRGDVNLGAFPPDTPPALCGTIERCLRKDPAERWRSAQDLWLAFTDIPPTSASGVPAAPAPSRARRIAIASALLALGVAAGILVTTVIHRTQSAGTENAAPTALEVRLPPNQSLNMTVGSAIALSPDGRTLVYSSFDGTRVGLYRRDLSSFDSTPIPGTDTARSPIFSPDGQSIAFETATRLMQMRLSSGQVVEICQVGSSGRGIAWLDDAHIIFNPSTRRGVMWTTANACQSEPLTTLRDTDPADHRWPESLPGRRALLYTAMPQEGGVPRIIAVDPGTHQSKDITEGSFPRFVAPRSLFFVRGELESGSASLYMAAFDPQSLSLAGEPAVVIGNVGVSADGTAHYSATTLDRVAYVPTPGRVLRVIDATGAIRQTVPLNESGDMVAVAPNGRRAVVALGGQLQAVDLATGVTERLTYEAGRYKFPGWSHDSRQISYRFQRPGDAVYRIMIIDAGGGTPREVGTVQANPESGGVSTWMPDGSALLGNQRTPRGDDDLFRMALDGTGSTEPVTDTPFYEANARVSSDGRLLAFVSTEIERGFNVFVQRMQRGGARRRVSPQSGCLDPNWGPDGRQLFYRCGNSRIYAVSVSLDSGEITVDTPHLVADRPLRGGFWLYGVLPDGGLVTMEQTQPASSVRVLLNWMKKSP